MDHGFQPHSISPLPDQSAAGSVGPMEPLLAPRPIAILADEPKGWELDRLLPH
jgi:hypothetical protein